MEFRMPDFFWWYDAIKDWRYERKCSWRKRFAIWPTKIGHCHCKSSNYVWLECYYSKGKRFTTKTKITNGYLDWGITYWNWHKVRTKEERTVN